MEIATLSSNITRENFRFSDCTLSDLNLPSLIATMKLSPSWANGELNALVLSRSPDKKIILAAMHEGTEIESFQSGGSITFHIIEGKLKFQTGKNTVFIHEGQLMTLNENVKYRLTTEEITVFILTILDSINKATSSGQ